MVKHSSYIFAKPSKCNRTSSLQLAALIERLPRPEGSWSLQEKLRFMARDLVPATSVETSGCLLKVSHGDCLTTTHYTVATHLIAHSFILCYKGHGANHENNGTSTVKLPVLFLSNLPAIRTAFLLWCCLNTTGCVSEIPPQPVDHIPAALTQKLPIHDRILGSSAPHDQRMANVLISLLKSPSKSGHKSIQINHYKHELRALL